MAHGPRARTAQPLKGTMTSRALDLMRAVATFAAVALGLAVAAPPASAQTANHMSFTVAFGTGNPGARETDSATYRLAGGVMEIRGFVNDAGRIRILDLLLTSFHGTGDYTVGTNDASWQNFSRDSICNSTSGSISVTTWDSAQGLIEGTFSFNCTSFLSSGDEVTYKIRSGVFTVHQPQNLRLIVRPEGTIRMKPGDTTTFTITVRDPSDQPVQGAEVRVRDSLQVAFNQVVGTTNDTGGASWRVIAPVGTDTGSYGLTFWASHPDFDPSDTIGRTVRVDSTLQIWTLQCNGLPMIMFDAGDGNKWEDGGLNTIRTSGTITLNGILKFDGSMQIDTTTGVEKVDVDGRLYLPQVTLPGGTTGDFVLWQGARRFEPRCGILTAPLNNLISSGATHIFGLPFSIEEFSFINGVNATGLKMKVGFRLPSFTTLCVADANTQFDTSKVILGFEVTNAGLQNLSFQTQQVGVAPNFCITNFSLNYSTPRDSLDIAASLKTPIATFGAGLGLVDGGVNAISGRVDLAKAIPLGTTPLALKGLRAAVSGLRVAPFKFTSGGTLVSNASPDLLEIDLDGTYQHPLKLTYAGAVRLVKTPVTGKWQALGTVTGTLDLNASVGFSGTIKAGNLGGTAYAISGSQSAQFVWSPVADVTASIAGDVTIPDIGSGWPFDWVNSIIRLPHTLAAGQIVLRQKKITANLDMTGSPDPYNALGRIHFVLDLTKEFGDDGFIDIGDGTVPLNATVRDGHDRRGILPAAGASLPLYRAASMLPRTLSSTAFDTVSVDSMTMRLVVRLSSADRVPASMLIDPTGATRVAGENGVRYDTSADGHKAFWTVIDPMVGEWILGVENPAPTDSVDFFGVTKPRPFSITADNEADKIIVRWDASGSTQGDEVDINVDNNGDGFDGFLIGRVPASDGMFIYDPPDSLPDCTYHVYATLAASDQMSQAYAPNEVANVKSILPPPTNIQATKVTGNVLRFTWTPSTDSTAVGYAIHAIDVEGHDSIRALPYSNQSDAVVDFGSGGLFRVYMIAFDARGWQGCPSDISDFAASVEAPATGSRAREIESMRLEPNPTSGLTTVRYRLSAASEVTVTVYDVQGRAVTRIPLGQLTAGDHVLPIETTSMASGAYIVAIGAGAEVRTERLNVVR